jgi:hypothetical protein
MYWQVSQPEGTVCVFSNRERSFRPNSLPMTGTATLRTGMPIPGREAIRRSGIKRCGVGRQKGASRTSDRIRSGRSATQISACPADNECATSVTPSGATLQMRSSVQFAPDTGSQAPLGGGSLWPNPGRSGAIHSILLTSGQKLRISFPQLPLPCKSKTVSPLPRWEM